MCFIPLHVICCLWFVNALFFCSAGTADDDIPLAGSEEKTRAEKEDKTGLLARIKHAIFG